MAQLNIASYINEPPFPRNYGSEFLLLEKVKGSTLNDTMDKAYLDFASGIAVNSLGYGRKDLAKIAARQMKKLIHVSNNIISFRSLFDLSQKLSGIPFIDVHHGALRPGRCRPMV